MNNTKVIVSVSPKEFDIHNLRELYINGMDVVRLNMSYCNHEFCLKVMNAVKKINKENSKKIAVLFDIAGPEIKIGKINTNEAYLSLGDKIRVYMEDIVGDATKFSINYSDLIKDVNPNDELQIDSGKISLKIIEKGNNYLLCEVLTSGNISEGMTINIPGRKLNMPFLSQKDTDDIKFACDNDCDFLSLSFVTNSEDVLKVSDLLIKFNNDHIDILTKVENKEAYEDIDEIIRISDGIIIARGDLGVEVALEEIPLMQKEIIKKCHESGKISIVSTAFLSSMQNNLIPTRAEVSDVSNAVLDGTDVILLSDDIAKSSHNVQILSTMEKIINATENSMLMNKEKVYPNIEKDITLSVAYSALTCAENLECVAIVTPTFSGYTPKKLSSLRPNCPIIAISPSLETAKNLALYYGIYPIVSKEMKNFDELIEVARLSVLSVMKLEKKGKIVITGGYPFSKVKHTNFMKVEEL